MRKIIVSEFTTLDGIIEDPGGADKFERGGWAFQFERGPEGDKFKLDETMQAGGPPFGSRNLPRFCGGLAVHDGRICR